MKKILQLDGGGTKGLIQMAVLTEIEKITGVPIHETFDLIVGTSVGSIIGGILASGKVSAAYTQSVMCDTLPKVFKKRFHRSIRFATKSKYKREPLVSVLNKTIGQDMPMYRCRTNFLCTAVCVNDGKNHFFKSWSDKDGSLNLIDVINRSYAAPYYFGAIDDKKEKKTWLDGGTGNSNCSLDEALIEAYLLGWMDDEVSILSIGTGYRKHKISFKKSKRWRNIREVLFYNDPQDGGLARNQSTATKVYLLDTLSNDVPNLKFQRLDSPIPKKLDKMDAVKYMDKYLEIGKSLSSEIDYKLLGL